MQRSPAISMLELQLIDLLTDILHQLLDITRRQNDIIHQLGGVGCDEAVEDIELTCSAAGLDVQNGHNNGGQHV